MASITRCLGFDLRSVVFGFVLGCFTLNLFSTSIYVSDLLVGSPCNSGGQGDENAPSYNERNQRKGKTHENATAVDCRDFHPPNDPNAGLPKNSTSKFVEKADPNFWIVLHEESFDVLRWNAIMQRGEYYETFITQQFRDVLWGRPRGIVIDVGMNIGWFTLYSRAMGHEVFGFDPNPIMHSRVCESLQLNQWWDGSDGDGGGNDRNSTDNTHSGYRSGVMTFAYGLGDQSGITLNLTMAKNPGASSFHQERLNAIKQRKHLEVPITTLDDVATQLGWIGTEGDQTTNSGRTGTTTMPGLPTPIYLLKIDAEGYEPWVVRGAVRLLRSGRVQNVLMECSTTDTRRLMELFRDLSNAGYVLHWIQGVGPRPTNEALRDGTFFRPDNKFLRVFLSESRNLWWKQDDRHTA